MATRSRHLPIILLCAATIGIGACSSTVQRIGPSEAALRNFGVASNDVVLVRYANKDDPRSSSRSELIEISNITTTGIAGVDENGRPVHADFDEIFQIEHRNVRRKKAEEMPRLGSAINSTLKALGVLALLFGSSGSGMPAGS